MRSDRATSTPGGHALRSHPPAAGGRPDRSVGAGRARRRPAGAAAAGPDAPEPRGPDAGRGRGQRAGPQGPGGRGHAGRRPCPDRRGHPPQRGHDPARGAATRPRPARGPAGCQPLGHQRARLQRAVRQQDAGPDRRPQRLHAAVLRRLLGRAGRPPARPSSASRSCSARAPRCGAPTRSTASSTSSPGARPTCRGPWSRAWPGPRTASSAC